MDEAQLIWRLGRWIARRADGLTRLAWADGAMTLRLRSGRIVAVEGLDTGELARRLGCAPVGRTDLLDEAKALAAQGGVAEIEAVGGAKELVERGLHAWFLDPARQLEISEEEGGPGDGPTISVTHAVVELILNDEGSDLSGAVLPDLKVLLRRTASFLELYAPLRLSEDADLIVAKITGQRTAEEVATRSPHGSDEVVRLLAALVATGMLEAVPVVAPAEEATLLSGSLGEEQAARRRFPVALLVGVAAGVVILLLALTYYLLRVRPGGSAASGTRWTVVVDMGCEPQDLQRMLRKASQQPQSLRAIRASAGRDQACWRLVFGQYASREAAAAAIAKLPSGVKAQGFDPHPIELDEAAVRGSPSAGPEP